MSILVLSKIWSSPPCKGGDLLCLLAIADNADESGYAWPSMETIARKAAMSERGARKCVRKLSDMGLITVETGGGTGNSNRYQITACGIGEANQPQEPGTEFPHSEAPANPEQHDTNTEQSSYFEPLNPEQSDTKPGTPVPRNRQEPSLRGGGVYARESDNDLTFRERIILAAGHDRSGLNANGRMFASFSDFKEFERVREDLGISEGDAVEIVKEITGQKRDGPAGSLKYFIEPLRRYAGQQAAPPAEPIPFEPRPNTSGGRHGNSRTDTTLDAISLAAGMRRSPGADRG